MTATDAGAKKMPEISNAWDQHVKQHMVAPSPLARPPLPHGSCEARAKQHLNLPMFPPVACYPCRIPSTHQATDNFGFTTDVWICTQGLGPSVHKLTTTRFCCLRQVWKMRTSNHCRTDSVLGHVAWSYGTLREEIQGFDGCVRM